MAAGAQPCPRTSGAPDFSSDRTFSTLKRELEAHFLFENRTFPMPKREFEAHILLLNRPLLTLIREFEARLLFQNRSLPARSAGALLRMSTYDKANRRPDPTRSDTVTQISRAEFDVTSFFENEQLSTKHCEIEAHFILKNG